MLRLTRHDPDDTPESYPFPREAARFLRGNRYEEIPESPIDRGASAAARRVEEAMRKVESRFKFLRELIEFPDPDRPRAA